MSMENDKEESSSDEEEDHVDRWQIMSVKHPKESRQLGNLTSICTFFAEMFPLLKISSTSKAIWSRFW